MKAIEDVGQQIAPFADEFFKTSPPADQLLMFFVGFVTGVFGVSLMLIWWAAA